MAIGRCNRCGRAFCQSHMEVLSGQYLDPFVNRCSDCWADERARAAAIKAAEVEAVRESLDRALAGLDGYYERLVRGAHWVLERGRPGGKFQPSNLAQRLFEALCVCIFADGQAGGKFESTPDSMELMGLARMAELLRLVASDPRIFSSGHIPT